MASQIKNDDEIKVFILYLLDRIGYPLEYSTIGDIIMQEQVVNFFDFATCFFDLVDSKLIKETKVRVVKDEAGNLSHYVELEEGFEIPKSELENSEYTVVYETTENGKAVGETLKESIFKATRDRALRSALRCLSFEKQGAMVDHSFRPDGEGYLVTCSIKDRKGVVMDLTIRAENEVQLTKMQNYYAENPEVVFRGVVAMLTGDANYIFED